MKVFLSWSGDRSRAVAEALHDWLPSVIQAVQPWMSANDIEKGTRWRSGLANELEQVSVSIICLTPENLEAPWIHFEAGALSKQQQNTYVCTFLFKLEPIDLREPLAQFQATKAEKEDIRKLVHTINSVLGSTAIPEVKINEAFDVWWPKLEQRLTNIQEPQAVLTSRGSDGLNQPEGLEHQRDVREILSEILELVRTNARASRPKARQYSIRSDTFISGQQLTLEQAERVAHYMDIPLDEVSGSSFRESLLARVFNDGKADDPTVSSRRNPRAKDLTSREGPDTEEAQGSPNENSNP